MAQILTAREGLDRFELLAAVGRVADGSLSLAETIERLLEVVVPAFADLASLDAVGHGGEVRRLGVRVDAGGAELERALLRRRWLAEAGTGLPEAISSGRAQLLSPVPDEYLEAWAATEDDLERLRSLGLSSVLFVPLRARGWTLGGFVCAVGRSGRRYGTEELRFVEVLAGRIALALDNAGLSELVRGLERRFEVTLANLAEAVLVRDAQGQILYANEAAAELLSVGVEEIRGAPRGSLAARYEMFDEQGRVLTIDDLPAARAQRGEHAEPLLVRNVARDTGSERWLRNKATPVYDQAGELSLIVSVTEEITDVKRAELSQRLLAQAGRELASSLDYQQTLQRVARLAVPELADWCGVVIRGEDEVLQQVAVAHVDPDKVTLANELGERYPPTMTDPIGAAAVIRSGQSQLFTEITDELLAQSELTDEELALVRELQMRSVIIVPLKTATQSPFGALSLVMAESGRVFNRDHLALAEELAGRAATAVENARLYTERSQIAATLQQSLLPPKLPDISGFRLASLYRAAGDQTRVGGDFYDVFQAQGAWILVIGDVTGRGAQAAALTSLSRYTLRTAARLLGDPIAMIEQVNIALLERHELSLVTLCCLLLRETDGQAPAEIVLAGHPSAYHVQDGTPRPVGIPGPLLGAWKDARWEASSVSLQPGDQLILYTDGVTDTTGEHGRFSEQRLARALHGTSSADYTVQRVEQALMRFARGASPDDTAMLVVQRSPSRAQSTTSRCHAGPPQAIDAGRSGAFADSSAG